jgi:hypothetical protein
VNGSYWAAAAATWWIGFFPLAELYIAVEPRRVFRRLLFVRRSHDECYKEQVFT